MSRTLLFIIILSYLGGMTTLLIGSETRVNTLGGRGEFVIDNSNISLYPALVNEYPNEIIGEIKRPDVACYIGVGRFGVMGVGLNIDTVPSIVNRAIGKAGSWRFASASPAFTIYYGKELIRSATVGAKFSYSNRYYGECERCQEIEVQDAQIGGKVEVRDENYIELTGGLQRFGFESKTDGYEPAHFKDCGNLSFNGRIRLLSQFSSTVLFILGANYNKIDVSWGKVGVLTEELSSSTVEGFVGMNLTPSLNTSLTLGAILSQAKGDTVTSDTTFTNTSCELPKIVLGIETNLTDWLTVRLGGWKSFIETESTTIREDTEISRKLLKEEKFSLSVGWGIKVKDFELDVLANDLPFAASSIGLSLTYRFADLF